MTDLADLPQFFERGLRFTLGAGQAMVEGLQDDQKRTTTLQRLQMDFNGLSEEWIAKGESTEQEARQFVESLLAQAGLPNVVNSNPHSVTITTTATPVPPNLQEDLRELTDQIIALRQALEEPSSNGG